MFLSIISVRVCEQRSVVLKGKLLRQDEAPELQYNGRVGGFLLLCGSVTSNRAQRSRRSRYSRSAVVVDPVDLAADEDADLAVLPPLLVGQQVGDQQGQTWRRGGQWRVRTKFTLRTKLGLEQQFSAALVASQEHGREGQAQHFLGIFFFFVILQKRAKILDQTKLTLPDSCVYLGPICFYVVYKSKFKSIQNGLSCDWLLYCMVPPWLVCVCVCVRGRSDATQPKRLPNFWEAASAPRYVIRIHQSAARTGSSSHCLPAALSAH